VLGGELKALLLTVLDKIEDSAELSGPYIELFHHLTGILH
jgi:hypothetical protein